MELFSILATCAALTFGTGSPAEQAYPVSEQECKSAAAMYREQLQKYSSPIRTGMLLHVLP